MKTVKTILFVSILLVAGLSRSFAGENEAYSKAIDQLKTEVENSFRQFPFEAINSTDHECQMVVTFTVNEQHEMINIHVEGTDEHLAGYVKRILERKSIELDAALDGKMCRMPIRFVNAR